MPRLSFPRTLSPRATSFAFLALLGGAIVGTAVFPIVGPLHRAAIWGFVLLVSFAGWGALVAQLAGAQRRPDLGLRLAWGMAAILVVGGTACLLSVANRAVLFALVLVGVGLQLRALSPARHAASDSAAAPRRPAATTVVLVLVAVLAGIQYYGGATGARLQTNDDWIAYLAYPEQILASGTLIEPFSMRRMAAYGGQSFLQALTLIGSANALQIPLLDMGVCLVVVLALLVGDRSRAPLGAWVIPLLLVLALPNIRTNSGSVMSGVVFFLALFRTVASAQLADRPRREALVLGMLAAAAATLRPTYIPPAAALLAIVYAPVLVRALRRPDATRRRRVADVALAPAAMLVCVLPWALLSYRSNATLLYPLFEGTYQAQYGRLTAAGPLIDRAAFLRMNLAHSSPGGRLFFFLAALLMPWRSTRGALPALTWASAIGFVAVVWSFPLSDVWSMVRYYYAFVAATILAVSFHVCSLSWDRWRRDPVRTAIPALLVVAAIALQVGSAAAQLWSDYREMGVRILVAMRNPAVLLGPDRAYRRLQAKVPAGAPLLVMLDQPFWLDFRRNKIALLDLPGQVSPPPGMSFDDDEELVRYLAGQGFRFLAFVRSSGSKGAYRRRIWEQMLGPPPAPLWAQSAPRYLKAFDRLESLSRSRVRVYDDGKMVVLDLARPVPAPP